MDDPCWLWSGRLDSDGYGRRGGKLVHRLTYEAINGPIGAGLEIDHLCRVRHCVNPGHLEAVTHAENMRRAAGLSSECKNGHPWSVQSTYILRGRRYCRICNREAQARMQQRKAAA